MRRRTLLLGTAAVALGAGDGYAQPLPVTGSTLPPGAGPGPLSSIGGPPSSLDLSFLTPGVLDPRITFTRASTATYFNSSGVMQTAATNAPRFDYDPVTHAARGLLIEEARTNMEANSVSLATWSPLQTTLVGAAGIAPDGTNSMRKLAEDASNNFHTALFQYTIVGATTYAFSVFAKAAENQFLVMGLDNGAAAAMYVDFDLVAGTFLTQAVGGAVISSVSMQPVGNGIYRCVLTGTTNSNTIGRAALTLAKVNNAGGFPSYQGVAGNGVLVWGVQFEAGVFPSSYIPTSGATVTRAQELTYTPTASWYNAPASTLAVDYMVPYSIPNASASCPAQLDDGTNNNIYTFRLAPPNVTEARVMAANVTTGVATLTFTSNTVIKAAATFANPGGAAKFTQNGAVPTAFTYTSAPAGISRLSIGVGRLVQLNGWVRRVRYWPRILGDAEMQQATT